MHAAPAQMNGMGARGLVDQTALPPWLAGAMPQGQQQGQSHGMQARSLVDEQALPEWLRKQPDEQPRPTVAGWLGASAAEEPLPSWMTPASPDITPGYDQMGGAPVGGPPQNGYAPQAPLPPAINPWQAPAYGTAAPPVSEDLALPDWLQAQAVPPTGAGPAGASSAFGARPGEAPSPAPQYQWQVGSSFEAPSPATSAIQSGETEAPPTMRAPNVPEWDMEPYAGETEMRDDQRWGASESWDSGQESAFDDGWKDHKERVAPQRVPLTPEEMPPWLRRESRESAGQVYGSSNGGSAIRDERQRMGFDRDIAPQQGTRRDSHGWDDEQAWDDGSGGWDEKRGGYDDRDNVDWNDGYNASPMQRSRDEWSDNSQEPDPYMSRHAQRDDEWGQGDFSSRSNHANADPYASQRSGYDMRDSRDPYTENRYVDDGMLSDGYDDFVEADEDHMQQRKGWRGFFRRGE